MRTINYFLGTFKTLKKGESFKSFKTSSNFTDWFSGCCVLIKSEIFKDIGYFDETMLGLTGRQEDIQSFTSSLSVFYQRINKEDGYDFNHTASIFVFNPEGLLFATMSPANTMAELSEDFSVILSNF